MVAESPHPRSGSRRDPPPSIGVVTFNAQQRALIETLLRDAGDDRLAEALDRTDGEGLFVKNLENVQGDGTTSSSSPPASRSTTAGRCR